MIQIIIDIISIRFNKRASFTPLLRIAIGARNIVKKSRIYVDVEAIKAANALPSPFLRAVASPSFSLLFVVTEKDFRTLPFAISCARNSILSHDEIPVTLIVPENSISSIENILTKHNLGSVKVINENSIADEASRNLLKDFFTTRYGWSLQQLLKVIYIMNSEYERVLVCDADTLLINKRPWVNMENRFILFPSYERNISYYRFLDKAFKFGGTPKFSFVSHHMLYSREILLEAFDKYDISNFFELSTLVVKHSIQGDSSPFSIDYEFYGQYLYNFHYEKLTLLKWSNLPLPARTWDLYIRSRALQLIAKKFYNSISFHSWS